MTSSIESILNSYNPKNSDEYKYALREIIQQVILVGLSRANFFLKASFYGGTALRIFYGLNRYSEDLDFTLNDIDNNFTLEPYISSIKEYASSYGLELEITTKIKSIESPIESSFAKLNTYQTFINLKLDESLKAKLHKDEVIKVKLEVDCNPALGFNNEMKWIDTPEFSQISVLDKESLFAGKIHAILCRTYKNNVKGRDYYDFLFYIQNKVSPNISYLKNKLIDTKVLSENDDFNLDILKSMLINKFNTVDFNKVKEDARKFIFINEDLSYYCKELFIDMVNKIK